MTGAGGQDDAQFIIPSLYEQNAPVRAPSPVLFCLDLTELTRARNDPELRLLTGARLTSLALNWPL